MKLEFLTLPDAERRVYIEQAAIRRSLSPVIMEKDFWVCWLLGILFETEFAGELVFKGGTSLSKVFGVIHRFSEDIDLSLSPQFLNLPDAGTSRTQANKWMAKAEAACSQAVQDLIAARHGSNSLPIQPPIRQCCSSIIRQHSQMDSPISDAPSNWSSAH